MFTLLNVLPSTISERQNQTAVIYDWFSCARKLIGNKLNFFLRKGAQHVRSQDPKTPLWDDPASVWSNGLAFERASPVYTTPRAILLYRAERNPDLDVLKCHFSPG
jgi:hypothetical protein